MRRFRQLVVLLAFGALAAPALAREDPREVEGRALFARAEYGKALDVFARLFAERADPVYLRNIGRCYQKLGKPEPSIDSFREYLHRAKAITSEERAEVEGFIREMEVLKASLAAPSLSVEPPATSSPPASPGSVVTPVPMAPVASPPPLVLSASPRTSEPITRKWWFWTAVGGAVLAGTVTAIALASGGDGKVPPCPTGAACPR